MVNQLKNSLLALKQEQILVWGFGIIAMLCTWLAIASERYFLVVLPAALVVVFIALVNFRILFYTLLVALPISTEIVLPNGFGTDLPTEPLMVGLLLIGILFLIKNGRTMDAKLLRHPITILLLLHLCWTFLATITSNLLFVSVKFSLAKVWYIAVFYFLAAYLLKGEKEQKRLFWLVFIPLLFTVVVTMIRHASYGFSFIGIHKVLHPFQRNHVNYAAMLAYFYPFVWFAWRRQVNYSKLWYFLGAVLVFFLAAIYLSFTRAAYIALFAAAGAYFIFKFRLIKYVLVLALVGAVLGLGYLIKDKKYLDYAPNYDRTVTHYEFDNLVEATYKMEDISTMERLYRWVAGFRMSPEEPWVGFGPGNFVNFYKPYTVTSFKTYVSHNPERSGIHSYYIMVLVEQGIIGLLLFLTFCFYLLIKGEQIYHQTKDPIRKGIVMSALLCMVIIDVLQIINDLLETDKVGPFFFLSCVLLVLNDFQNKKN